MKTLPLLATLGLAATSPSFLPSSAHASTAEAAEITQMIITSRAMREARQLLDDRDAMHVKARTAEALQGNAGVSFKALGFSEMRRDLQQSLNQAANHTAKIVAYQVHAQLVAGLVKQIEEGIAKGLKAPAAGDIARYELLWSEVELARVEGRLPESPEKVSGYFTGDLVRCANCFNAVVEASHQQPSNDQLPGPASNRR